MAKSPDWLEKTFDGARGQTRRHPFALALAALAILGVVSDAAFGWQLISSAPQFLTEHWPAIWHWLPVVLASLAVGIFAFSSYSTGRRMTAEANAAQLAKDEVQRLNDKHAANIKHLLDTAHQFASAQQEEILRETRQHAWLTYTERQTQALEKQAREVVGAIERLTTLSNSLSTGEQPENSDRKLVQEEAAMDLRAAFQMATQSYDRMARELVGEGYHRQIAERSVEQWAEVGRQQYPGIKNLRIRDLLARWREEATSFMRHHEKTLKQITDKKSGVLKNVEKGILGR